MVFPNIAETALKHSFVVALLSCFAQPKALLFGQGQVTRWPGDLFIVPGDLVIK